MVKKKQQGNGSSTVYPQKNKEGKITGYCGSYFKSEGANRTSTPIGRSTR